MAFRAGGAGSGAGRRDRLGRGEPASSFQHRKLQRHPTATGQQGGAECRTGGQLRSGLDGDDRFPLDIVNYDGDDVVTDGGPGVLAEPEVGGTKATG